MRFLTLSVYCVYYPYKYRVFLKIKKVGCFFFFYFYRETHIEFTYTTYTVGLSSAERQNDRGKPCHYNVKDRLDFTERLDLSARFQYIICRVRACPYRRLGTKRCGITTGKGKPLPYNIMCLCIL